MNRRTRNDIPFRHCEDFYDEAISEEEDNREIATPFILPQRVKDEPKGS